MWKVYSFILLLLVIPLSSAVSINNPDLPLVQNEPSAGTELITGTNYTINTNRSDFWDNLDTPLAEWYSTFNASYLTTTNASGTFVPYNNAISNVNLNFKQLNSINRAVVNVTSSDKSTGGYWWVGQEYYSNTVPGWDGGWRAILGVNRDAGGNVQFWMGKTDAFGSATGRMFRFYTINNMLTDGNSLIFIDGATGTGGRAPVSVGSISEEFYVGVGDGWLGRTDESFAVANSVHNRIATFRRISGSNELGTLLLDMDSSKSYIPTLTAYDNNDVYRLQMDNVLYLGSTEDSYGIRIGADASTSATDTYGRTYIFKGNTNPSITSVSDAHLQLDNSGSDDYSNTVYTKNNVVQGGLRVNNSAYGAFDWFSNITKYTFHSGLSESPIISFGTNGVLIGGAVNEFSSGEKLEVNGNIWAKRDNDKTYWGAGKDAYCTYDGTNFICNPKAVGSGQMIVQGTLNVTENLIVQGNVSIKRPYGMFSSTETQTIAVADTAYPITFNWTEDHYQMSIVGETNVTIVDSGDYEIILSGIVVTDLPNKHVEMWVQKNGVNVERSNTKLEFPIAGIESVIAVSFILDLNTGDSFRIMWASDDAGTMLQYTTNTSYSPETPSIIMTVSKVGEITA